MTFIPSTTTIAASSSSSTAAASSSSSTAAASSSSSTAASSEETQELVAFQPANSEKSCPIADICDEVLLMIAENLSYQDLCSLCLTSKTWKAIALDPSLWTAETTIAVPKEQAPLLENLVRQILHGETPSQAEIRKITPLNRFDANRLAYCGEFCDSDVADTAQRVFLRLAALGAVGAVRGMLERCDEAGVKTLISARDKMGRSARSLARSQENTDLEQLLHRHGAPEAEAEATPTLTPFVLRPELSEETQAKLEQAVHAHEEGRAQLNPYGDRSDLIVEDLVGGPEVMERLPVLEIPDYDRRYIDYIDLGHVTAPVMRGADSDGRPFICLRLASGDRCWHQVLFKRYTRDPRSWSDAHGGLSFGGGHPINNKGPSRTLVTKLSQLFAAGQVAQTSSWTGDTTIIKLV